MTAAAVVITSLCGLFGLAIGSFLNVVVHRVPRGESVVSPPSHCPHCEMLIRDRHNVPVLGWLVLRGRCYDCAAPISARYPIVEALTGVLFAAAGAALAGHATLIPAALWLVAVIVVEAGVAVDHTSLPTAFRFGAAGGLVGLAVVGVLFA
jgi:leader peptidase (prepilin peptidase)/N-methyltransferase